MKKSAKRLISAILGWQVRRLQQKNEITVITVAGSIGKTSTKFAIGSLLKNSKRVRFQEGNYNDIVTVPLAFFGLEEPSVLNPIAWTRTILAIEKKLRQPYPFDVVVTEIGTDAPGQIAAFSRYLNPDIGVLTAISPEHMEYFDTLGAVADEELALAQFSKTLLVNADLVDASYLKQHHIQPLSYAIHAPADYSVSKITYGADSSFTINKNQKQLLQAKHRAISEPQLYSLCAAIAVADHLGVSPADIIKGIANVRDVSGRLNQLAGIKNSIIIDDTYNSSPQAVVALLDTIYRIPAPQKIAILGNMNELGKLSPAAHSEIGKYCDPKQLSLVVTLGPDANEYLAPAARERGCTVQTATSPQEVAQLVKGVLQPHALILAKGSQNGVFAEEAVKALLANPSDISRLVRQSDYWMSRKGKQFKS